MTENENEELEIQKSIITHVNDFKSFLFNAGAGAGKTHALIETLRYISTNIIAPANSSQKIACITYTNVAANEIKVRLGNSEIVHVSTIHERLWSIIKNEQPQLLACHREKVEQVLAQNKNDLIASDKAKFYNNLDDSQMDEFFQHAMETKEIFYKYKNEKAPEFRSAYLSNSEVNVPTFIEKCLKNVDNFKFVIKKIYTNQKLINCIKDIDDRKVKTVYYDSNSNTDRLHYMKFSHNTLLEYGLNLIETYPILCRIIIDNYPYLFIDEYQDTHINVVKIVKTLHSHAIKNQKKWIVGYFGDTAQCIYDDGVGRNISKYHDGLYDINKIINRRSHQQIIDVINNIRADEIVQKPFSKDRNNGSVIISHCNSENKIEIAQQFLAAYKRDIEKMNATIEHSKREDAKLHCLVLTNALMAELNKFDDVYEAYSKSIIHHDYLNTQVLSHNLEKLHPSVLLIYKLIKLHQDIRKNIVTYYDIFGAQSKNMTFSKACLAIRDLENKDVVSFKDWIYLITNALNNSEAKVELAKVFTNLVNSDDFDKLSSDKFQSTLYESIKNLMCRESENECIVQDKIEKVLTLPINSLINWVNFIDAVESNNTIFHTYHGTKGEEYNNVAIILEHRFGRHDKGRFKNYFATIQHKDYSFTNIDEQEKHLNTRNLLYVACSRAIKNLRILYLDDISEIKEGIESVFGHITPWMVEDGIYC